VRFKICFDVRCQYMLPCSPTAFAASARPTRTCWSDQTDWNTSFSNQCNSHSAPCKHHRALGSSTPCGLRKLKLDLTIPSTKNAASSGRFVDNMTRSQQRRQVRSSGALSVKCLVSDRLLSRVCWQKMDLGNGSRPAG